MSGDVTYSQEEDMFCQERIIKLGDGEVTKSGASSLQDSHGSVSQ